MQLIENLDSALTLIVSLVRFFLEVIAVFCVLGGLLETGKILISPNRHNSQSRSIQIRLSFGMWLVLALEFQLGSDIVSTTIAPTFESLGKLGIIALIRTFINYFLTRELEAEHKRHEK
ncbi:protein of unknown function DUF1622 [Rippkaea orientalis PCC 8801]|uniref:DUF1622 domain-containing protein n=1 Tax=Rippkaea orientalis (strain PCC 8801 / RF-1) TaxID=41431 RepID=B7K5D9_RIPO1|nr:DUF1622 domain-containing protein [Rippkaea orientalis]ACK67965.1 protein of unknown function DUF1622 [Rippkaea orientalis PCC 8801]